jgi:hypothetical protein
VFAIGAPAGSVTRPEIEPVIAAQTTAAPNERTAPTTKIDCNLISRFILFSIFLRRNSLQSAFKRNNRRVEKIIGPEVCDCQSFFGIGGQWIKKKGFTRGGWRIAGAHLPFCLALTGRCNRPANFSQRSVVIKSDFSMIRVDPELLPK